MLLYGCVYSPPFYSKIDGRSKRNRLVLPLILLPFRGKLQDSPTSHPKRLITRQLARSKLFKTNMPSAASRTVPTVLQLAGILSMATQGICASDASDVSSTTGTLMQMNGGARIECVTPNGQTGHVSKLSAPEPGAGALIMEDDTVACLLQEGQTDFVVELPKVPLLDRLTFLNENARARGELKIAVSNERLKADSSAWVEVEGVVPFSHKRLFGVSLLGIEAKFVRLSFRVEKSGRIAALINLGSKLPETNLAPVPTEKPFAASALQDALDSKFATRHARESILLTVNTASVGPLSASAR